MFEDLTGQPKLNTPVTYDACPVCGSKVRLGATIIQELKDEGKLHKDAFNDGMMMQIGLLDQAHPPAIIANVIKIKVIVVYWDVCECGAMYCYKFDCIETPAQVQTQQQRPLPRPNFGTGRN